MRVFAFLAAAAACCGQSVWIGTWGAAPAPQTGSNLNISNATIRDIVHISQGGTSFRVRISNAYGKKPVEIRAVHIALRASGAAIVAGSDHIVTFGGQQRINVPADALAISDPIAMQAGDGADLAVSIYVPGDATAGGIHYGAQQTNYIAEGDATSAAELPRAKEIESWYFLTGVDVEARAGASSLVAFGDSITDGAWCTVNANHRWPDYFAEVLEHAHRRIGVLNEGIGGNRILHDPNQSLRWGVSALARFDRDVLAQPGVKYVIVLEGINDLGHASPDHFPEEQVTAGDMIWGLKQMIARAHEKGIKIFGATLTPFAGTTIPNYYSDAKETERKAVNLWIRSGNSGFDGVIDFERAVSDTANPDHMRAEFDSGDHLHPKDAGYEAMAKAIDVKMFQ